MRADSWLISPCIVYYPNTKSKNYIYYESTPENIKRIAQIAINAERGNLGTSVDYILETHEMCLREGIDDPNLRQMYDEVKRLQKQESHAHTHLFSKAITDVEVYDSPAQVRNSDLVIGVPQEIREALGVNQGEFVVVHNGLSKLEVSVAQTDSRLTSNGSSRADSPANHCWMTPAVRQQLGVSELPKKIWEHRSDYPAFRKKYSSVKITKD